MKNNLVAILALREVKGIGAAAIKKLWINKHFDGSNYYEITESCLRFLKKLISDEELRNHISTAHDIISEHASEGINLVDISDERYPKLLKEPKGPPSILYYKGPLENASKCVGIIGTREAPPKTIEIAKRISNHFSDQGYSICNGLAVGIDEACVRTETRVRGNVVGVVAGGLNYNKTKTLLKTTAALAEKVLENGGLILSEYPCNTKEDTFKVVDSCTIQAGLPQGLILIQSKADGGSKYTLKAFAELHRPLGVVCIAGINDDISFEANRLLTTQGKEGLSLMTGIKSEMINVTRIIPISQKTDYDNLQHAMKEANRLSHSTSLFD